MSGLAIGIGNITTTTTACGNTEMVKGERRIIRQFSQPIQSKNSVTPKSILATEEQSG